MSRSEPSREKVVLVVEDDADDLYFLRNALRKAGLEGICRFVYDGPAAIAYMKGEHPFSDRKANPFPDILVLDLSLPRIDGFGVLEWMRGNGGCERVPVVVWTSWYYPGQLERARKAGARLFLKKAAGGEDLRELIALISSGTGPAAVGPGRASAP